MSEQNQVPATGESPGSTESKTAPKALAPAPEAQTETQGGSSGDPLGDSGASAKQPKALSPAASTPAAVHGEDAQLPGADDASADATGSESTEAHDQAGALGNIFAEDEAQRAGKPRGPDLHITVDVPSDVLGDPQGYRVPIPEKIEVEGAAVPRKVNPDDREGVPLHLPQTAKTGMVLRLRGQGGLHEQGVPGDLFVKIHVVQPPPRSRVWPVAILAVLAAALAIWALVWAITSL